MTSAARKHEPEDLPGTADHATDHVADHATEYATRGARGHRIARPHLRIVSPLRPERAGRGLFALIVGAVLGLGMVAILVINTTLAQGAFTVGELQAQQAQLAQREQALSEAVAAASAPKALESSARSLGMVPSENPVFLQVPQGRVLGKPKPAGGVRSSLPRLLTPADATVAEAVDNGGADLPQSVPVGYDPAAADLAAADAKSSTKTSGKSPEKTPEKNPAKSAKKNAPRGENGLWQDSTVLDVTGAVSSGDAGLSAVPVD